MAVLICLVLIGFAVFASMDFRWSDEKYIRKLDRNGAVGEVAYHADGAVRSIRSGDPQEQPMIFLHGAPGSSRDYSRYLSDPSLLNAAYLIAVDRPGYGNSGYGVAEPSIISQADLVATAIPDSSIIVGHSFGGPVAAALAMYHPRKVRSLILLAPAVDPEAEKKFAFNGLLRSPLVHCMLSGAIRTALEEKRTHVEALIELSEGWDLIDQPVTVIHGERDRIVPFENTIFLERELVNTEVELHHPDDMGHIMIWTDYEWVREQLLQQIANMRQPD